MNLFISHIRKDYHEKPVLKDCSFEFGGTGVYALMGPNGCGKSTLLRICALIEDPTSGNLLFQDNSVPLVKDIALRRRMTLVLPRTGVFNSTAFNNVAYGLKVRGMDGKHMKDVVYRALEFVGLTHKSGQNALTLSSGETQRLGIARALAINPEILFLDEPTASVDEENTVIIESIIGRLKRDGRTLVIITTHDREQAERVADHLLFLRDGTLHAHP